ncbi:hypothetical protein EJ07DRAFT_116360 [Lizonia empirigonia]|nr:hypothetical protein EJ07DRAFT_116360 [Lizonia empirigonia]
MTAKPPLDPANPIHWILDWDGTITQHDTLDALVSITASTKPDAPVLDEWKRVSEAYMADYTAALAELAPGGDLPKTVQAERKLLQALASVEQTSLDRVSASGIFAGLTRACISDGAKSVIGSKKVELRDGFAQFLQHTHDRRDGLDLLSVNWSRHFIASCLSAGGARIDPKAVYANELDGIENDVESSGKISPDSDAAMKITSSSDKLAYLSQLRARDPASRVSANPTVYIGDSWTDMECLLAADLGICMRASPPSSAQQTLALRLQSLGIQCPHLHDLHAADEAHVAWARDFSEIQAWAARAPADA